MTDLMQGVQKKKTVHPVQTHRTVKTNLLWCLLAQCTEVMFCSFQTSTFLSIFVSHSPTVYFSQIPRGSLLWNEKLTHLYLQQFHKF